MTADRPTPYIGYSNTTLASLPMLGERVDCPHCGKTHPVIVGDKLQFFICGSRTYVAGIEGKDITRTKPDVSGQIPGEEVGDEGDVDGADPAGNHRGGAAD